MNTGMPKEMNVFEKIFSRLIIFPRIDVSSFSVVNIEMIAVRKTPLYGPIKRSVAMNGNG